MELTPYAKKKAAAAKKAKAARKKGTGMTTASRAQSEAEKIAKAMNKMMAGTPSTRKVIKKKK